MTFTKPYGITFTQMAQWIDHNAYDESRNNDQFIEYLYHISHIKAEQHAFFNDYSTYDDFALFCVSKFLTRYSNRNEAQVKSVVNYLKTVIDFWRAEYVREFCSGSADMNIADFNVSDFGDYLIDSASFNDYNSFYFDCFKVSDVVWKHLKKIPRRKNSPEWTNIYTSCLLTLQDRLKTAAVLCSNNLKQENPQLVNRIIRDLKTKPPILFHIDESRSMYISVLVNEIVHAIASELMHTTHTYVSVSSCLQNLVKAANNKEDDE